ncbi:MAG TPA: SAM-dependent chlorinase/fluorinase [Phnomibacter sp.]|nr:SAM-dependent chlorinase/fluorinase [Phnomibacter sp.]
MAIVTLTSDFGTKDYLAGAFKGRLLFQHPACKLVDITHEIGPFNFSEAAYIIKNSVTHFPEHSFHLLLVNMFDTVHSLPVLAFHKGRYYGVPDNGLLPMVLGAQPDQAISLPISAKMQYNTLAWADLFGKAIHHIENGLAMDKLGRQPDLLLEKTSLLANYTDDHIDGRIIFIDRFENVVVNITRNDFDTIGKGREFTLAFTSRDTITRISEGYPQVSEGNSLAFFNAAGYLEISVNKGNAASLFGLQSFNHLSNPEFLKLRMFYQTVRILFH